MTKRITICIDVSDENVDEAQAFTEDAYGVLMNYDKLANDPKLNWDVCIDDVKEDGQ